MSRIVVPKQTDMEEHHIAVRFESPSLPAGQLEPMPQRPLDPKVHSSRAYKGKKITNWEQFRGLMQNNLRAEALQAWQTFVDEPGETHFS